MLNKKQMFVVSQIPRWAIANELNTFLGWTEFKKSDDRLTDELCRKYATGLGKCFGESADEEDRNAEAMREKFIVKHFPKVR